MSDILSQLITLPVRIGLGITFVILIILYLLAIVWVNRDAHERDTSPVVWTVIAVIPVAGLVAYCLMRPPLTKRDASEQDMELKLLHNQLKEYGSCPHCGYPTQKDFIICPHCRKQLRNVCSRCGRVLEPEWVACPYCTTPVHGASSNRRSGSGPSHGSRADEIRARNNRPREEHAEEPAQDAKDPFAPSEADIAE